MIRALAAICVILGWNMTPLLAANEVVCLSRDEQRAAVERGQAVPLAAAIRAVSGQNGGRQVVRAQLCREGKTLVYVLTVLARDGKVTHTRVNAKNGDLIEGL
ncbi:MAG TPA: hypothetical protein VNK48_00135 [Xanthobacteraceae bacterium]|nr:hypothetical protein [Xanthobacteraceae bacterium]